MLTPGNGPVELNQIGGAVAASIGPAASAPPGLLDVPPALGKRMAVLLAGDMRGHFDRGASPQGQPWAPIGPRPQGGSKPLLNTGKLRNSITGEAEPHGASAGTVAVQANIQNAGGVITPKNAKMLAIPLTREAIYANGPRKFPRPLRVIRTQAGKVLLVESAPTTKTGKVKKRKKQTDGEKELAKRFDTGDERLIVQYVLVPSVTIPARPFNGFTEQAIADATDMAVDFLFGGKK